MAIRYDTEFNRELKRVVSNYNAKINRLMRADSNLSLPEKTSIKELKKIEKRSELKRTLRDLEKFSIRGAERQIELNEGVNISKFEYDQLKRDTRRVKSYLTRRINTLSGITPKIAGVKQDATYAEMGSMQINNYIASREALERRNINKLSKTELKDFIALVNKQKRNINYQTNIFRENYLDKMLFNLGYNVSYDKNKIESIKNEMNKLSDKQFLKMFDNDLLIQAIRDYYNESHKEDVSENAQDLINIYDELYENITSIVKDYQ